MLPYELIRVPRNARFLARVLFYSNWTLEQLLQETAYKYRREWREGRRGEADMASATWAAKLNYMRKLDGVHKWEKRWVAKGSMMVAIPFLLSPAVRACLGHCGCRHAQEVAARRAHVETGDCSRGAYVLTCHSAHIHRSSSGFARRSAANSRMT